METSTSTPPNNPSMDAEIAVANTMDDCSDDDTAHHRNCAVNDDEESLVTPTVTFADTTTTTTNNNNNKPVTSDAGSESVDTHLIPNTPLTAAPVQRQDHNGHDKHDHKSNGWDRRRWMTCAACFFFIMSAAAVVLGIVLMVQENRATTSASVDTSPTLIGTIAPGVARTPAPTPAPTSGRFRKVQTALIQAYPDSAIGMLDHTTAQYRTIEWLADEDDAGVDPDAASITSLGERYVAALLYFATGGDSWSDTLAFLSNTTVCDWNNGRIRGALGIYCSGDDRISRIILGGNNLDGTIPTDIRILTELNSFRLPNNNLVGTIPDELIDLPALLYLDLGSNGLDGSIPNFGKTNTLLQTMSLNDNHLTGNIPVTFRHLESLRMLNVGSNLLHRGLLSLVVNLPKLAWLDVSNNDMTGTLPSFTIYSQPTIKNLYIQDNDFNLDGTTLFDGSLLPTTLVELNIGGNQVAGTTQIPPSIGDYNALEALNMSRGGWAGILPTEIGWLQQLVSLDLSCNEFRGNLPEEMSSMVQLQSLRVNNNDLEGILPAEFSGDQMPNLEQLWLHNNEELVGNLTDAFCQPATTSMMRKNATVDILIQADCSSGMDCTCCQSCDAIAIDQCDLGE